MNKKEYFYRVGILRLQLDGYAIFEYVADDFKFYDLYQHNVINQKTSTINNIIKLV